MVMINKQKKTCSKCNRDLHIDNFKKVKKGISGGKQIYTSAAWCNDCKADYDNYKTCTICKHKLPKTSEYFHVKNITQMNKSGETIYHSYVYACKECLNPKIAKHKREKYWENPEEHRKSNRKKYWKDPEKSRIKTQEWRIKNIDKLIERDRKRVEEIQDSWLASSMGIPVAECPKELLENKRSIIFLKRELGLTHSTIKERNIKK